MPPGTVDSSAKTRYKQDCKLPTLLHISSGGELGANYFKTLCTKYVTVDILLRHDVNA